MNKADRLKLRAEREKAKNDLSDRITDLSRKAWRLHDELDELAGRIYELKSLLNKIDTWTI